MQCEKDFSDTSAEKKNISTRQSTYKYAKKSETDPCERNA